MNLNSITITTKDIKNIIFLLIFSVSIAFLYNHFSPFGIAVFGQWETSKGVVNAISKNETFNFAIEINDPNRVQQIITKKERIVVDARHKDFYDMGHLPGALSYPLIDFDTNLDQMLSALGKNSAILVYCSSFECTDSHTLASRLIESNFTDVKVFAGGYGQWVELGFKIEKNEE